PNRRFRKDSNKSPINPVNAISAPTATHTPIKAAPAPNMAPHTSPAPAPAATPAITPDQGLLGDRPLAIRGPPISFPPKYANTSAAQMQANSVRIVSSPSGLRSRSQRNRAHGKPT